MRDLTPQSLGISANSERDGGTAKLIMQRSRVAAWPVWLACVVAGACGGDGTSGQQGSTMATAPAFPGSTAGSSAATTNAANKPAATTTTTTNTAKPATPASGGTATPSSGAAPGGAPTAMSGGAAMGMPAAMGGAPMMMGGMPAMTAVTPNRPTTPAGPKDGDPSKPMVSIPGVTCGPARVSFGAPPPTVAIGGRNVFVAYPCKHEGAPVTFFLFIHGTVNGDQKIPFTLGTYSVHELVDSHNLIVVAPQATGSQWGNGDNGVDLPHLYEVIDWTYSTFGEKFDIRSMWAHGGSWGAFYLSTFACDPMLEDRLNGVYMVVGGGCPRCSSRLSCVVIQQELEKGMGMTIPAAGQEMLVDSAQIASYATMHGCDGKMGPMPLGMGGPRIWNFPNCDKGWYHAYVLGPGEHADKLDQNAVIELTNQMKMTEEP